MTKGRSELLGGVPPVPGAPSGAAAATLGDPPVLDAPGEAAEAAFAELEPVVGVLAPGLVVAVGTVVIVLVAGAVVVVVAEEATFTTCHVPPKLITPSPVASDGELSLT